MTDTPNRTGSRAVRRLLIATVLLFVVLFGLLAWALRVREQAITADNYARIEVGMTQAELDQLLGGRASATIRVMGKALHAEGSGAYVSNFSPDSPDLRAKGFAPTTYQQWQSPEITINVVTDESGKVICRYRKGGNESNWLKRLFDSLYREVTASRFEQDFL